MDPICTFLFSLLVLVTTFNILRDTMMVLMEGMPKGVNFSDVLETFMSIEGVVRVHNLRVWALSPDKIALAAHLAVSEYNAALYRLLLCNAVYTSLVRIIFKCIQNTYLNTWCVFKYFLLKVFKILIQILFFLVRYF